jgi:hypothetical protein
LSHVSASAKSASARTRVSASLISVPNSAVFENGVWYALDRPL